MILGLRQRSLLIHTNHHANLRAPEQKNYKKHPIAYTELTTNNNRAVDELKQTSRKSPLYALPHKNTVTPCIRMSATGWTDVRF